MLSNYAVEFYIRMTRLKDLSFIAFNLVIIAFILATMWLGNGKMTIKLMLFSTVVCIVLTLAGEFTLRISRLTAIKARLPLAFVIGFAVVSIPMMALTLIFNISALAAFVITALSTFVIDVFSSRKEGIRTSNDWTDIAITLFLSIVIGLLAKMPISSPATLLNTGVLPVWSDYFIHGASIASFGSAFATGTDMELAGVSRGFYHYSPYMIPAAFQVVSGMSGLALSTSLLLPLGLLIAALGSYVFAVELGGRLAGLLALTAIICIPAFSAFIQSGWFDFYWLLFSSPGAGYAIGVSAVVCAAVNTYPYKNNIRLLWLTILLLFSLIVIRVHMFMLLAPAIVTVLLIHHWSEYIRHIILAAAGIIIAGVLALNFSTYLHALWIQHCNPYGYLDFALQWASLYGLKIKFFDYPVLTIFAQLLVVLVAVLGIYFALYLIFFSLSVRRSGFHSTDALPLLLVMGFIGLMLFAPTASNGDMTEYKHRHFLLLYVIIAIYTVTYARTLAIDYITSENKFRQLTYAIVTIVFSVTVLLNWNDNPARPNIQAMPWTEKMFGQNISPGILESAEYLKTHARHGDVLAMGATSIGTIVNAPVIEVVSLSGVPAFIARPALKSKGSQCVKDIATSRLNVLRKLSSIDNWNDARIFLQTNGIRWYLTPAREMPSWDSDLKDVAFSSNGMHVYDAGLSTSVTFRKAQC